MSNETAKNLPRAKLNRLHHAAWVTKDMEATRQFYEEVVGLPMTACWKEKTPAGVEYCHTFFEMADGSALAFFDWQDEDVNPRGRESPGHLAMECDSDTQAVIKERLAAAGYKTRQIDHGYCVSLYVTDPNNFHLEFTADAADSKKIFANHTPDAHRYLREWMAGDRTINNNFRDH